MDEKFAPPEHLSSRSQALWLELVPRRARSAGRLALLTAALEALDRAEQARVAIAGGDLTSETKKTGAIHINPLLKIERECRTQFAKIWSDLAFGFEPSEDGVDFARWQARQSEDSP